MATAHHLSVIANSCVKPPVNPDTGLSATLNERSSFDMRHTWDGYTKEYEGNQQDWQTEDGVANLNGGGHTSNGSLGLFRTTDSMIQGLTSELGNVSDEAFYQKLLDLKNEHKKTLHMCEKLYTEKVGAHNHSSDFVNNHVNEQDWMNGSHHHSDSLNNSYNVLRRSTTSSRRDNVKDMSKPPTGRSRPQSAKPAVMRSQEYCLHGHVQAEHNYSDEENWRPLSAVTTDAELSRDEGHSSMCYHHHHHPHHDHNDSKHSALSHIEDMWDNFSVEEYAPPKIRQRSSSLSRLSNNSLRKSVKEDASDTKDWRHRITMPKPFSMSLRESAKEKEKSKTLLEYEFRKEQEQTEEDRECQKKFKAKPVPAHVYMPLFEEQMEEMESRRKLQRENSKELLKSIEKPFNFVKREEERKRYRHKKCATNDKDIAKAEVERKPPTGFKAKPFPAHIFDSSITDRLQEEEEYRKIRVQMRAEELLQTSSLPPNMTAKGKEYTDGKSRQKLYAKRAKKAGITSEHKFRPRINEDLPDFEEKHRQLQMELSKTKRTKEATVCKPFNLRTERIASKKHKVYEDIARDSEQLRSETWSFNKSNSRLSRMRSLSSSMDSIPTKMTASSQLRSTANRTKLQKELDAQLAELERERQQRLKEKKMKKYISERVALNDNSRDLERSLKAKMKDYKESERARKQEYLQMLNEIDDRIEKRPFLFERALQTNAKQAAERKYKDTLRRAGLDEDFISTKGKEATADDMDAISDEEGYNYSRHSTARSYSSRSRSGSRPGSRSESRHYTEDYDGASNGNRTSEGSDFERD